MAYALGFTRAAASVLDAITTYTTATGVISWFMAIDEDAKRLRIFDGTTTGGIALAKLSDIPGASPTVYNTPTTGGTVTASAGNQKLQLTPAGTLATLTVTLPPSPSDDDEFHLSTTQTITALTVNAPGGATVLGGSGLTLTANGGVGWRYRSSNTTWYAVQ